MTQAVALASLGNGPAFYANGSTNQSCTNGANTKVIFNNEVYDTANAYDTTNNRFTPTVAGYYQISAACSMAAGTATQTALAAIWRSGGQYAIGSCSPAYTTIQNFLTVSALVYLNGTTDYVEIYLYHNYGSTWSTQAAATTTWFTGSLVRGA